MGATRLECLTMNLINFGRLDIFIQNISGVVRKYICMRYECKRAYASGKWSTDYRDRFLVQVRDRLGVEEKEPI